MLSNGIFVPLYVKETLFVLKNLSFTSAVIVTGLFENAPSLMPLRATVGAVLSTTNSSFFVSDLFPARSIAYVVTVYSPSLPSFVHVMFLSLFS